MENFQLLVDCSNLKPLMLLLKNGIWPVIQFVIPLLIIILGAVDLGKAVASGDDKKTKEAQSTFVKRVIYGVAIFFVPLIINLVFNMLADNSKGTESEYTFADCWNYDYSNK